jgi:hypothetical protein
MPAIPEVVDDDAQSTGCADLPFPGGVEPVVIDEKGIAAAAAIEQRGGDLGVLGGREIADLRDGPAP